MDKVELSQYYCMNLGRRKPTWTFALLLLALSGPFNALPASGQGQECPYTEADAVADTLDPSGYYPLDVGIVREYVSGSGPFLEFLSRSEIVADTMIDGARYFKEQRIVYDALYRYNSPIVEADTNYSYVNLFDGIVTWWTEHGIKRQPEYRLNSDINTCYTTEDYGTVPIGVDRSYEQDTTYSFSPTAFFPPKPVPVVKKVFTILDDQAPSTRVYGFGLGLLTYGVEISGFSSLTYARINGVEYGTPLDSLFEFRIGARPELAIDPDTVFFIGGPAGHEIIVSNATEEVLRLSPRVDSLRFSTSEDLAGTGWSVDLIASDSTYSLRYVSGRLVDAPSFPMQWVTADTLRIILRDYEPCASCAGSSAGPLRDTLFIYSNDSSLNPYPVPIDFSQYVSTEATPPSSTFTVEAYPNPAVDRTTVRVAAGRGGRYEAALFNVLGQRVYRTEAQLRAGDVWQFYWPPPGRPLAGGTYVVRVTGDRMSQSVPVVIVR